MREYIAWNVVVGRRLVAVRLELQERVGGTLTKWGPIAGDGMA